MTSAGAQPAEWWRTTRSLATWLTCLFGVQAVSQLVNVFAADRADDVVRWHRAFDAFRDGRDEAARRIMDQNQGQGSPWATAIGVIGLAALVLHIIWAWRSAHNARALGRVGERLSPGWAIGAWFIPLANFVLVYIVFSDLWRSSDPTSERGDGWRRLPGSALVRLWTAAYVGGLALYLATLGLGVGGVIEVDTIRVLLAVAGIATAVGTGLSIAVVREITARQEALQARDPAPTTSPVVGMAPLPTTLDGPGWYADPAGAHDHRYWDGREWTEHVSRGGVAGTAPVTPADWYPDPTGRFHWRYWTGQEWTEHVSRDGTLYLDALDDT
jgi:hypothetical protein